MATVIAMYCACSVDRRIVEGWEVFVGKPCPKCGLPARRHASREEEADRG